MSKFIYWIKEGKFVNKSYWGIPWVELHSPNEETPALIYPDGAKEWWFEGKVHRLSGPAIIWIDGSKSYCLNDIEYEFKDWILNHPNIDIYLETQGLNETQNALWKLKNL